MIEKPVPPLAEKSPEPLIPKPEKAPNRPKRLPEQKKQLDKSLKEDRVSEKKAEAAQAKPQQTTPHKSTPNPIKPKPAEPLEQVTIDQVSPLFIKPSEIETAEPIPQKPTFPSEVVETLRNGKPEATKEENLEYSLNTYQWTFQRYVENWAIDIQKWWKAPLDYVFGKAPEGGEVWIQVKLDRSGRMLGYRILKSQVTAEMELMVIQALVGSLERSPMPDSFNAEMLVINWRFIYPPLRPQINLRR